MEIRQVTEEQTETYWALRLRALREEPQAFGSSYEEARDRPIAQMAARFHDQARTPDAFTLGAFDGEQLLGMVTFTRETLRKFRHAGTITAMYVAPEARGQGIGRALLQAVIDRVRTLLPGVEQLHLTVVTTNTAARTLYHALGFAPYGLAREALKLEDGTYLDEELLELRLPRS